MKGIVKGILAVIGITLLLGLKSIELDYIEKQVKDNNTKSTTRLKGAGNAESPYLIESTGDLEYVRDVMNNSGYISGTEGDVLGWSAYYRLENNIEIADNTWITIKNVLAGNLMEMVKH